MFPSETLILVAVWGTRDSGSKIFSRPMDVMNEYIGYYCNSLVKRGYLKKPNMLRGYKITSTGKKVLLDLVRNNEIGVECEIKRLQQLGIKNIRKIDGLKKKAITVKQGVE